MILRRTWMFGNQYASHSFTASAGDDGWMLHGILMYLCFHCLISAGNNSGDDKSDLYWSTALSTQTSLIQHTDGTIPRRLDAIKESKTIKRNMYLMQSV